MRTGSSTVSVRARHDPRTQAASAKCSVGATGPALPTGGGDPQPLARTPCPQGCPLPARRRARAVAAALPTAPATPTEHLAEAACVRGN